MKKIKLEGLQTEFIGVNTYYYKEIDSTQKEVWRRIEKGEFENGDVIVADIQLSGIGTHGRKWYTSQKGNIAFSICIIPNCKANELKNITTKIADIIVKILYDIYKINISIKSPNDLMINGKKVGGILTETKLVGENVKFLVIGIGINTNKQEDGEIIDIATSVKKEFNIKINNKELIKEFCNRFEKVIKGEEK